MRASYSFKKCVRLVIKRHSQRFNQRARRFALNAIRHPVASGKKPKIASYKCDASASLKSTRSRDVESGACGREEVILFCSSTSVC